MATARAIGGSVRRLRWPAVRMSAVRAAVAKRIRGVELAIRIAGIALVTVAVGSYDWRAGLAVAGASLILSTIDPPRRLP